MKIANLTAPSTLCLSFILLISACGSVGIDSVEKFKKELSWSACTGKGAPGAPFECSILAVPVDYRNAAGDTAYIALVRLPASAGKAKGIILTNPGGPGESGFEFVRDSGSDLVSSLGIQEFDLIGFDPRGVDRSEGIRCFSDKELDAEFYGDDTPDTQEEKELRKETDDSVTTCSEKYGKKLKYYSTEYTARDMDLIRSSMGYEKVFFLGISYGTYLGGVYATLFPDRVAAMVLDGAYDPQGDTPEQTFTTQAEGFEKAFNNWVKWCEAFRARCSFSSQDVKKDWLTLYGQIAKKSLVSNKRYVNHKVMKYATIAALYAENTWAELGDALTDARDGDGFALLELADSYLGRDNDGSYSSTNESAYVIMCASGLDEKDPQDPKALMKKLRTIAPWYHRELQEADLIGSSCEEVFGKPSVVQINYTGNAPIVVIGGKNDPATPFRWSEEMTQNMGSNAHLVVFTGEGHSQILVARCVDRIAGDLFTKNDVPVTGATCAPDVPMRKPAWWDSTVSISGVKLEAEVMNSYFGLNTVDAFTEYYAIPLKITDALRIISRSFRSKGFNLEKSDETDPVKSFQWFVDGIDTKKFVGIWMSSVDELEKAKFVEPEGNVPENHIVVAVSYFP